jgi:hypothetical protein
MQGILDARGCAGVSGLFAQMRSAPLITIRPGPVLHVWDGGKEIAAIPLSPTAALFLLSQLLEHYRNSLVAQVGTDDVN